ncbi:MAG: hypothetical protein M1839_007805 [Geoglossum umbratile]|nr:MAG: hypothetical protein M1839_007805 [Geoglossum umbratile]
MLAPSISTMMRNPGAKPGWAEKRLNLSSGKMWPTPGPYLRKSMLKALSSAIRDYEPPAELFGSGVFDGTDGRSLQEEKLVAPELLAVRW